MLENPRPIYSNELYHYGVMGMHWGIRRYQPYPSDYKGDGKFTGQRTVKNRQKDLNEYAGLSATLAKHHERKADRRIKKMNEYNSKLKEKYGDIGKADERELRKSSLYSAKAKDSTRTRDFWKAEAKKAGNDAKKYYNQYSAKGIKTQKPYENIDKARSGYIRRAVGINAARQAALLPVAYAGGVGIGAATAALGGSASAAGLLGGAYGAGLQGRHYANVLGGRYGLTNFGRVAKARYANDNFDANKYTNKLKAKIKAEKARKKYLK